MKELQTNLVIMIVCYIYIVGIIFIVGQLKKEGLHPKSSRKLLHTMIGALPLIMPFFTHGIFPFLVASPFVIITFLITPYSPAPWIAKKLSGLTDITKEGHHLGLVLYSLSYAVLAYFFGDRPYILASGIFPMAYGDSVAAMIGKRYGKYYIGDKSIEGSFSMFVASLISLLLGMVYFSSFYEFSISSQLIPILTVSIVVTLVELVSPHGSDNITVPLLGVLTFIIVNGGI